MISNPDCCFTFGPIADDNGFRMEDYWVWCPSVIRGNDGKYHMFASRWPRWLPFHPGWMTNSEIVRAVATCPEGPYTFAEVILPARGAEFWDGCSTHNPTVRFHRGKYYLFYVGTTHPLPCLHPGDSLSLVSALCAVARSNKRVGLAWADSIEGPWHRLDQPILPTVPGTFFSFLTSNPAPWIDENGQVTLLFKSRAYEGDGHGPMMIGLAEAPAPEGPYIVVSKEPVFSPGRFGEVEDPFLWRASGGFHLIAKDMTGQICGQAGGGIYGTSRDAIHWELGMPAYHKTILRNDGTHETYGNLERPFLLFDNQRITHLCAAASNARKSFLDISETWNAVLPVARYF